MPRSKREGIFFGVVMALTVSIFMNLFNSFRHGGVSLEVFGRAMLMWPIIFVIVMLVENFIVSPLAHRAMSRFVKKGDSTAARGLAQSVCMVTGMSLTMSVIGLVLAGTSLVELPVYFLAAWPINFFAAFWWQLLVAGPVARGALRVVRSYRGRRMMEASGL